MLQLENNFYKNRDALFPELPEENWDEIFSDKKNKYKKSYTTKLNSKHITKAFGKKARPKWYNETKCSLTIKN